MRFPTACLPGAVALALMTSGCTTLLPRGSSVSPSPFGSYAEADAAAARIVPFETQLKELKALGFDPDDGRNVTLIPYPDLLARLVPYSGVPLDSLDPGIRRCIEARSACRAYIFHFDQQTRKREGSFWTDFLNVSRTTRTVGWSFDALVVVADGRVLFRNTGGQPHAIRVDRSVNPLGPFQGAGEASGSVLIR